METSQELKYAVKDILIQMAVNDTLPMDMNALDIDMVFELAEATLKGDKAYQKVLLRNKLSEFTSMDEEDGDIVEIWESLTAGNDNDMADDHFTMWEPLQYTLTIKQLAEQL